MFKEILDNVKRRHPIIHSITNYVTANDCANILIAVGASPIMSDNASETEDISAIISGLNINIGTPREGSLSVMLSAGKYANMLSHPVVLDPVGVGASVFRRDMARQLLSKVNLSVIRCNFSELKTLALDARMSKGIDADIDDEVSEKNLLPYVKLVKAFSEKTNAVVAVSGGIDIVADGDRAFCIFNGHPMMRSVTGTGCQLSAIVAAFAASNPDNILKATAAAFCTMGICGEIAYERLSALDGSAAYRGYIIDAAYNMDGETLEKRARYKIL